MRRLIATPDVVARLAEELCDAGALLRSMSARSVAETLGSVGARFADPDDALRLEALAALPATTGLSEQMCEHVLDGMCRDWTAEVLTELLEREFGDPAALDDPAMMPDPPRLTTHIGSGTVPGVTATSLVRSLLVKSPALVKPGLGDVVLPVLWAQAIQELDPALGSALAVFYWPGDAGGISAAAYQASTQVVVYGSDATVEEVGRRLGPEQRLVAYPHRVGVGAIGREARTPEDSALLARNAALWVATFDQRGCVSPHVIYVEEGEAPGASSSDTAAASSFAEALAAELSILERELPSGPRTPAEAAAFQQLMGTQEMRAAADQAVRVYAQADEPWAVIVDRDPTFVPSCLGRFVWVKPIEELADLPGLLTPVAAHLQTVALDLPAPRAQELARTLTELGASRITTFEEAPWPRAWWRHDGHGPLRVLLGLEA